MEVSGKYLACRFNPEKRSRCPLDRRLSGPHSQSRHFGVGKKFFAFARILVRNGKKLSFMYLNVVSQRPIQRLEEDHDDLKSGYPFRQGEKKTYLSEDKFRASLMYQFIRK